MSTLYDLAGNVVRRLYDWRIHTPAVLDPERYFPGAARFTSRWREIREEALRVAQELPTVPRFHDIMRSQADISANDGREWRMFVLQAYGVQMSANLRRCPLLASLLAQSPEVTTACFSFVAAGKHIPPHRGPFRGVLRFHLGLEVPPDPQGRPGTVLVIDGVEHRIGAGDSLLWDDTYPHELRNVADQVRVALLLDVRRPQMPVDMRLLSGLITHGAAGAIRLSRFARSGGESSDVVH